jgi:glutamine synthetase
VKIASKSGILTSEDVVALVREKGIRNVSLMHVGGDGWLKTLDFVPLSADHLRDILAGGERADGSSLFSGTGIKTGASDIVLRPRIDTAFMDPFAPHPTLCVLCSHVGRDGEPLDESPDTIVRRAHRRVINETDTELWALGECEYFLGRRASEEDIYGADDRGYHATAPFVFGESLRREAMAILGEIGVPVKYGHSEVGYVEASASDDLIWEQHEIELALAPLPKAADALVLTQWVLRNLAHKRGMRCRFAPMVREGHAGSGLHFHFSPVRSGYHLAGTREDGSLPEEAKWLIGGLARMAGVLMAFGNTEPGSFDRLLQGKEAPTSVTWGRFNRDALIRLPIQAHDADGKAVTPPTIEFRLPDGSAHPHLLLAAAAQAMLRGRGMELLEELLDKTHVERARAEPESAGSVPRDFAQVADAVEEQRDWLEAGGVFPPGLLDRLVLHLRA